MNQNNPRHPLNIVQWNAKSLPSKLTEITHYLQDFDIGIFSETWLNQSFVLKIRSFDSIRKDRMNNRGGGVAILIKDSIKYKRVADLFDCGGRIEIYAVEVLLSGVSFIIASCYRPPDAQRISPDDWGKFFLQFKGNFLFCGDFNAHHPSWGDQRACSMGNSIVEGLDLSKGIVLNDGSPSFHSAVHKTNTCIDISIAHEHILSKIFWSVGNDLWGSDHFPIFISINANVNRRPTYKKNYRPYSKHTD